MTENTTQPAKNVKRHRSWGRFRLRTLLILIAVLSVSLGWVSWELDQRRSEQDVVAWIEELGGHVERGDEPAGTLAKYVDPKNWWEKTTDKWFGEKVRSASLSHQSMVNDVSPLAELKDLKKLWLQGTDVSDLTPLASQHSLNILDLMETQVIDLTSLSDLKNLKLLLLGHTQVSDLSPLANLYNLERLDLYVTPVDDLSPLADLKHLRILNLSKTQVTDLSPLADLKNLEVLTLSNTRVSDEQLQTLKAALPNCIIYR